MANATKRPLSLASPLSDVPLACEPSGLALMRWSGPPAVGTTNTSMKFVSPGTRLLAGLVKTTVEPSALSCGSRAQSLASPPVRLVLRRRSEPSVRSNRKASSNAFVAPEARFVAMLWNATKRPSALIVGWVERPLPGVPSAALLTIFRRR